MQDDSAFTVLCLAAYGKLKPGVLYDDERLSLIDELAHFSRHDDVEGSVRHVGCIKFMLASLSIFPGISRRQGLLYDLLSSSD